MRLLLAGALCAGPLAGGASGGQTNSSESGSRALPGDAVTTTLRARQRAAAAPGALPLSLDEALALALRNGQEVQLARSRVDLAGAQITAARAEALPQISGDAGYTRTFKSPFDTSQEFTIPEELRFDPDPTLPLEDRVRYLEENAPNAGLGGLGSLFGDLPFGQKNAYTATLSVSQLLYSGGQTGAALRIAQHVRESASLNLAEDAADVRRDVRIAYYQALLAQELAAIAEEGLAQADRVLEYEQLRREAGQVAELDVLRAEVSRDNLRPQLVAARNALELALLNLKRLADIPLGQPIVLTTELTPPSPAALAALADRRLEADVLTSQRAAVQAAERLYEIRGEQVSVTRGRYLPRVTVDMRYGQQVFPQQIFDFTSNWRTDWTAGVTVRVPIFNGFRRDAEIAQARVEQRQAELQLAQLKKAVQLEHEQALGEKERAQAAIAARQRTAEVAQEAYDLTVLVFEQGLTTQLQVSDSRLQLLQARSNLAQAIADFHIADAGIVRARTTPDLSTLPPAAAPAGGSGGVR